MVKQFGNAELHEKENFALVALNPGIFSLPVIFSAAYVLLDKAFIVIDGSIDQIVVSMQPKEGKNLRSLVQQFNGQLINYSVNAAESKKTERIRNELIKRALLTQSK
jgi:His-Xaa-Ser system protein HxsD